MEKHACQKWQLAMTTILAICWSGSVLAADTLGETKIWPAGLFSFSDETGGYEIISVTGLGSRQDPIVITQKLTSLKPSTMTIRNLARFFDSTATFNGWTSMHLQIVTLNISAASWIGYRFELQEEPGKPSIYGDGLSFNQIGRNQRDFLSDRFIRHEVEHEPGDRLVFEDGWVNQREYVEFNLYVLDLSPVDVFYLVQVPQLPAS